MQAEVARARARATVDGDVLTVEEAEALSKLSRWTLARKKAPRIKVGRAVRYSRRALLAWVESQTQNPKGGAA